MVRVLVPSFPGDPHAIAVKRVLEARGHEAEIWHTADFPTRQAASIAMGPDEETRWELAGGGTSLASERAFDVVWFRRPVPPVLDEALHPGDRRAALRESEHFVDGLWRLVAPHAFWVNPFRPQAAAPPKPLQLHAARAAGLRIPATLCSNDAARIRAFLERLGGRAVFKPFYPAQWRKADGAAHTFTSELRLETLPDPGVLRLCPGVFQERVEKAYELRVTWMGATPFVARLRSQEVAEAVLDWRRSTEVPVEPASLPDAVAGACQRLMAALGLVFGCIDLVVTPAGEHVFLEVNEMGQFLWLEECAPGLRLLDAFAEFLVSRRRDFRWQPRRGSVSFLDLRDEVDALAEQDRRGHVAPPNPYHFSDVA